MAARIRCLASRSQYFFSQPAINSLLISTNTTQPSNVQNFTKTYTQFKHLHVTSTEFLSKSKGKTGKKYKEIIRPVDAEHIIDLIDVENQIKDEISELRENYIKEFRVGADLSIFQSLKINLEDDEFYLNEVARITKQSPRLVTIDMVEFPEYIKVAEKSIRESKLNLNPSVKGTIINIPISQVTNEHRIAVVKLARQRMNTCKDAIRKIVSRAESKVKAHEKNNDDFEKAVSSQLNIYCSYFFKQIDSIFSGKEKEILKPS